MDETEPTETEAFKWSVLHGDCLEVLKDCPDNFVDSVVCDPPAGIDFMHLKFDSNRGGRDQWIAWLAEIMKEVLRCTRPGGHAFVWALPRTSHWTAMALEDSGWEVRGQIVHLYGSGFPKSQNVGAMMDKLAGAERQVVGERPFTNSKFKAGQGVSGFCQAGSPRVEYAGERVSVPITAPATEDANTWDGWGTATKPSHEIWWLARKPLAESSIARNILKHGTGGLNIDACRVHRATDDVPGWHESGADGSKGYQPEPCHHCSGRGKARFYSDGESYTDGPEVDCIFCSGTGMVKKAFAIRPMSAEEVQARCGDKGRWPPDLVLSHSAGCVYVGVGLTKAHGNVTGAEPSAKTQTAYGDFEQRSAWQAHGNGDGTESVERWKCEPDCPVAELDRQSGVTKSGAGKFIRKKTLHDTDAGWGMRHEEDAGQGYGDGGGASRFFPTFRYQAKPSRSEREAGCEDLPTAILNRVNPGGLENEPRFAPVKVKNNHPCVKSLSLMTWLIKLITPPNGIVLDPFAGSGSTGAAAVQQGFRFVGIEESEPYVEIARARLRYWETKRQCDE